MKKRCLDSSRVYIAIVKLTLKLLHTKCDRHISSKQTLLESIVVRSYTLGWNQPANGVKEIKAVNRKQNIQPATRHKWKDVFLKLFQVGRFDCC